jgi:hypothetical protein
MKHVYTHDNIMIVNSAKNILALNGIEAVVKNEDISNLQARHGINNIFIELWILNDQELESAKTIIEKEVNNPKQKDPWQCSGCNEENEGSFELCWNCHTPNANS